MIGFGSWLSGGELLQVAGVLASSDLSWIWGVAVAAVAVIWGIWRDLDARKARRDNESLRRRLDLRPLVELFGWAEWDAANARQIVVHADFKNHGPGPVRNATWGATIAGTDVWHGRNIPVVAEGAGEQGTDALWIGPPLSDAVPRERPSDGVTWWIEYDNSLDERLEVRFRDPETMDGPTVVKGRVQE
jgi:hypothetical protein